MRKIFGFAAMLASVALALWSLDRVDQATDAKIYARGKQEAIGRPMRYKDVPIGHYHVVAVVEEDFSTAVIERDDLGPLDRTPEKADLLVTDMMPSMMHPGHIFAVGGTSKK